MTTTTNPKLNEENIELGNPNISPSLVSKGSFTDSTGINEKALLRKVDLKLLPPLTLLYLLSFLDRSNIGNARLVGLSSDLGISGNQYLTTLTIFFIGYVLFEIPCNIILKRTSPRLWLPMLMLSWGIVATLMGVAQSYSGLLVARFFLGVTESGLFPGVVFYLSMWYKRNKQHYRISLFFSAASLAGAFGGILAYGIGFMGGIGGLNAWRWIFILEGLLTTAIALSACIFIHNYPATAKFLTEPERAFIHARLKGDNDATNIEPFTWHNALSAIKDPKCWLYAFAFHTLSLPLYTLSLFLPTIIAALGYTAAQAQLLTVPPYAIATRLMVLIAIYSEKAHRRAPFILGSTAVAITGYIILLTADKPGVSYVSTIFAAARIYPATAIVLAWPASNVSGQTKRATANALQISVGNLGAVLGTQLYRPSMSPRFYLGNGFAVGYLVGNMVVVSTLRWLLNQENQRRERVVADGTGIERDGRILGDDDIRWNFQT